MPFSVARCVMERSPHSMLVGKGVRDFAINSGCPVEPNSALQTQISKEAYEVISFDTCHSTAAQYSVLPVVQ